MQFQSSKSGERKKLLENAGWAVAGVAILCYGLYEHRTAALVIGGFCAGLFGLWLFPAGILRYLRQDGIDLEPEEVRLRTGPGMERIKWDNLDTVDSVTVEKMRVLRLRLKRASSGLLERVDRNLTGFDIIVSDEDVQVPLDEVSQVINFYLANPELRAELSDPQRISDRLSALGHGQRERRG